MEKNKLLTVVVSILIGLLGYFGQLQYSKLSEIEKSLLELKIEVVKMQTTMIDRDMVIQIVHDELEKHGIK
jgi:hypothetical protein